MRQVRRQANERVEVMTREKPEQGQERPLCESPRGDYIARCSTIRRAI
jgi:hypothetical protein